MWDLAVRIKFACSTQVATQSPEKKQRKTLYIVSRC